MAAGDSSGGQPRQSVIDRNIIRVQCCSAAVRQCCSVVEVQSAELCKLHTFHDVSSDAGLLMAAAVWQMVASRSVDIYNIFFMSQ